jgi:hypothetical protein
VGEEKVLKTKPSREDMKCSVDKCKRPYRAKGYCVTHYKAWRRGELEGHKARYNTCSKEGCRKPVVKAGVCVEHSAKAESAEAAAPAAT